MILIDGETVRARLDMRACIDLLRPAMIALARGQTRQLLRGIVDLDAGRAFGVMPGALGVGEAFGAKLISVYPENFHQGKQSHQGVVALFDPADGAPVALVHAGEITAIRTAAASALATDALARRDAARLAVLGYGEQAERHVVAMACVRDIAGVRVWGRSPERTADFAARVGAHTGLAVSAAANVRDAVDGADIVCTTTAAAEPILLGDWIAPGTHLNLVGSSRAGPVEVDHDVVVRARFFADHREGVLRQGAEFLRAKEAGLVGDDHVLGDIGAVLAGDLAGRTSDADVTAYKSLGSIVQDLACAWHLVERARSEGFGVRVPF
ncbi:ornithine cyclodeaminase family protein [Tahibacter soli]|uniref:Ornithine cyclodeaminase family protein n=1 Tax=Tahibacter soli TaxID=2983605 RepID=A0A9X3YLA0_9GAMM|nr:ornithine cyclodeaminase family protein [Tahibacter soli]MDC8013682.1 ornithine cyclodeaminase family protein [Tahibacter soli]